jgi:aminoglycoside phosphotransferase (APT) family kinase protein
VVRVEGVLAEAFPHVQPRSVEVVDDGWDSRVLVVEGEWIVRIARNDDVAKAYALEERVLAELAPALPLEVPRIVRRGRRWALTRRVEGTAFAGEGDGRVLGAFLRVLHAFPADHARELGVPEHDRNLGVQRFIRYVLPQLDARERPAALAVLDEYATADYPRVLAHTDLLPDHLLVSGGALTGVIDWTDLRLSDAAFDLAWPLFGAPPAFADAVCATYGVDEALSRRAHVIHALEPWHEVEHGVTGDAHWIESGLAGLRERLPKVTGRPDTMAE